MDNSKLKRGFLPYTYVQVSRHDAEVIDGGVIEESQVTIYVNGFYLASLMCSPLDEIPLAIGFLYNEGIIHQQGDIADVTFDEEARQVFVQVHRRNIQLRRQMMLTAGCGGGVTFQDLDESRGKVQTDFQTVPQVIFDRMSDLRSAAHLYNQVRGVHTSILGDAYQMNYVAEDVGRHNTIDKIAGKALRDGYDASQSILMTSGRISSEMLGKANRMNIPIVASRTAPTSTSVRLALAWDICLIGYVRQNTLRVYTHPYRLGL